ncbi:MAG: hypothetical protein LQ348_002656 [Seirophora lacunosa]|nr:MAG: hypothetical protein LQ348_002656 [Seirophora lacunosa]
MGRDTSTTPLPTYLRSSSTACLCAALRLDDYQPSSATRATTSLLKKTYNKTIHLLDMKETQVEGEPRSSQFNQESLDQETSKEIIDQHSIDQGDLDQESFDQENIGQHSIDQDSIDQERIGQDSVAQDSIDQETVERETLAKQRRYAGIGLLLYSLPLNNIKSHLSGLLVSVGALTG